MIEHYTLNKQWEASLDTANTLPDICGIKQDNIRAIEQRRQNNQEAQMAAILASYVKCQEYVKSLFYRAKCISENENNSFNEIIRAWKDMTEAAEMFVSLFSDIFEPEVNAYEKNPFCYLITAYASMCNEYIRFQNQEKALCCLEKATATAIDLYKWGCDCHANPLAMEDIIFFVEHTPQWCCNKVSEDAAISFINHPKYEACKKRIENSVFDKKQLS